MQHQPRDQSGNITLLTETSHAASGLDGAPKQGSCLNTGGEMPPAALGDHAQGRKVRSGSSTELRGSSPSPVLGLSFPLPGEIMTLPLRSASLWGQRLHGAQLQGSRSQLGSRKRLSEESSALGTGIPAPRAPPTPSLAPAVELIV